MHHRFVDSGENKAFTALSVSFRSLGIAILGVVNFLHHLDHGIFRAKLADLFSTNFLLALHALIDLLEHLVLDLTSKAELFGGLADCARRQIEVYLVDDLAQMSFHVSDYNGLR